MIKKFYCLLAFAFVFAINCTAISLDGNGTSASPYLVKSVEDFTQLALFVNSGENSNGYINVRLCADLDFSEKDYIVVGNEQNPFSGCFDGDGYRISNVSIEKKDMAGVSTTGTDVGLFGYGKNSCFMNVRSENIRIKIEDDTSSVPLYSGLLCARLEISDSKKTVGAVRCEIVGCSDIDVPCAKVHSAGLFGYAFSASPECGLTIRDCNVISDIFVHSKRFTYLGGVVGRAELRGSRVFLKIDRAVNHGTLVCTGESSFSVLGGIVGFATVDSEWTGLYGSLYAEQTADVENCFFDGNMSSDGKTKYMGSVCGYTMTATAKKCFCTESSFYQTKTAYSLAGEKALIEEIPDSVGLDMLSVWELSDKTLSFRKRAYADAEFSFENKTFTASVQLSNIPDCTAVCVFYGEDGKILRLFCKDYFADNSNDLCYSLTCDEKPSFAEFVFINDEMKPISYSVIKPIL